MAFINYGDLKEIFEFLDFYTVTLLLTEPWQYYDGI